MECDERGSDCCAVRSCSAEVEERVLGETRCAMDNPKVALVNESDKSDGALLPVCSKRRSRGGS